MVAESGFRLLHCGAQILAGLADRMFLPPGPREAVYDGAINRAFRTARRLARQWKEDQEFGGALGNQEGAAPQQVAQGALLFGVDVTRREDAKLEQMSQPARVVTIVDVLEALVPAYG